MDATQQANRALARDLADTVGGTPTARRYYLDDARTRHVDIAKFVDRPQPGVITYATLGLSDTPLPRQVRPPLGVEVLGVCDAKVAFHVVLAAIAGRVKTRSEHGEPGAVFPNVVPAQMSATLRHAVLVPQFLWESAFGTRVVDYKTVAWLLAVPISDAERDFCAEHGPDALEARFEQARIDIFNPNRPSAV
ncbi:antitoxin YqcF [Actinoplanes lobatus]|uniref:Antitoxin YqcF n=1 Tax=Actinoplanes lobatus TaxID=113568 RepID=A0A7W7HLK1_9ACTN|nr:suppressor of fused domain protein [Actinoplanes lobatus]MBB4752650.1 hypothetical protein [Actinoplanes lobatus]GGN93752.1 antitoxin YqcF [Actinoplanes lobatus]GIE44684.1 antitoxin YqcF [Actinoplanes lobatus]